MHKAVLKRSIRCPTISIGTLCTDYMWRSQLGQGPKYMAYDVTAPTVIGLRYIYGQEVNICEGLA